MEQRLLKAYLNGPVWVSLYRVLGSGDYPVLMAIFVLGAVFVIAFNLIADILYAVMDPDSLRVNTMLSVTQRRLSMDTSQQVSLTEKELEPFLEVTPAFAKTAQSGSDYPRPLFTKPCRYRG